MTRIPALLCVCALAVSASFGATLYNVVRTGSWNSDIWSTDSTSGTATADLRPTSADAIVLLTHSGGAALTISGGTYNAASFVTALSLPRTDLFISTDASLVLGGAFTYQPLTSTFDLYGSVYAGATSNVGRNDMRFTVYEGALLTVSGHLTIGNTRTRTTISGMVEGTNLTISGSVNNTNYTWTNVTETGTLSARGTMVFNSTWTEATTATQGSALTTIAGTVTAGSSITFSTTGEVYVEGTSASLCATSFLALTGNNVFTVRNNARVGASTVSFESPGAVKIDNASVAGGTWIAVTGAGSVTLTNGASISAPTVSFASTGTVVVGDSTITADTRLAVGGSTAMTVAAGGVLNTSSLTFVGASSVYVDGGRAYSTGAASVADSANLTLTNGGQISVSGNLAISSKGDLLISGSNSRLYATGELQLNGAGTTVTVENGGTLWGKYTIRLDGDNSKIVIEDGGKVVAEDRFYGTRGSAQSVIASIDLKDGGAFTASAGAWLAGQGTANGMFIFNQTGGTASFAQTLGLTHTLGTGVAAAVYNLSGGVLVFNGGVTYGSTGEYHTDEAVDRGEDAGQYRNAVGSKIDWTGDEIVAESVSINLDNAGTGLLTVGLSSTSAKTLTAGLAGSIYTQSATAGLGLDVFSDTSFDVLDWSGGTVVLEDGTNIYLTLRNGYSADDEVTFVGMILADSIVGNADAINIYVNGVLMSDWYAQIVNGSLNVSNFIPEPAAAAALFGLLALLAVRRRR